MKTILAILLTILAAINFSVQWVRYLQLQEYKQPRRFVTCTIPADGKFYFLRMQSLGDYGWICSVEPYDKPTSFGVFRYSR